MTASGSKSLPSLGFLTVREFEELGLIGGYLLLNTVGRPLEFHCTAPVRPNRAQQILYGPTLAPFLYGEQIGQTLVAKSRAQPLFICTDVLPALSLREHVALPVALLEDPTATEANTSEASTSESSGPPALRIDHPHATSPPAWATSLHRFRLDDRTAAVGHRNAGDQETILQRWQPHSGELDLLEPFGRLADAIDEAQQGANR